MVLQQQLKAGPSKVIHVTLSSEAGLHGIRGRKHSARGALQIGRRQRSQEKKSITLLATDLGCLQNERLRMGAQQQPTCCFCQVIEYFTYFVIRLCWKSLTTQCKPACCSAFKCEHSEVRRGFLLHSEYGRKYRASPSIWRLPTCACPPPPGYLLVHVKNVSLETGLPFMI